MNLDVEEKCLRIAIHSMLSAYPLELRIKILSALLEGAESMYKSEQYRKEIKKQESRNEA